ncbi:MAG TPA: tRNA lysidine(34) synthetase TilS [Verrucomicrobiota bacterium]|nr:tRNA lysidine(34) synthetase TilS [Verrucomicrobiota bacterium]
MSDLVAEVRAAVLTRRLFERGESIVVAVSGGLDSMVLLRLLDELALDSGWSLIVAHFNHGLRGREADRDEALVLDSAWRLGWPCVVGWADSALRTRQPGISIEMAARQARHRFFAEVAAQSGSSKVALGQHADDQIETVLLRLLRGAGGEGLAGIRWLGPSPANAGVQLVRPLLGQTRATLRQWAAHARVSWREDRTNACVDMSRNWLRIEIVPKLRRRVGRGLAATVARTAALVGAEADLVNDLAREWRGARRRAAFGTLHVAVQRRILVQQFIESGIDPEFELVEALRTQPGVSRMIGAGLTVRSDVRGHVEVERTAGARFRGERHSVRLDGDSGSVVFGGMTVAWRIVTRRGRERVARRPQRECFDADRVGSAIVLRHWQPGDRFCPIGQEAGAKLQDLFVNAGVPRAERHRRVIALTAAGELFWVEGLRMAERFKIRLETRRWLEWCWSREG